MSEHEALIWHLDLANKIAQNEFETLREILATLKRLEHKMTTAFQHLSDDGQALAGAVQALVTEVSTGVQILNEWKNAPTSDSRPTDADFDALSAKLESAAQAASSSLSSLAAADAADAPPAPQNPVQPPTAPSTPIDSGQQSDTPVFDAAATAVGGNPGVAQTPPATPTGFDTLSGNRPS